MQLTIEELSKEALILSNESKALLIDKLVASIDTSIDPEIERIHLECARQRRDEIRQGKVHPLPGTEAIAKIRQIIK